jgi:hypothetical protein
MLKADWQAFLSHRSMNDGEGLDILTEMGISRNDFSVEHKARFDEIRASKSAAIVPAVSAESVSSGGLSTETLTAQLDQLTGKTATVDPIAHKLAEYKKGYPSLVTSAAKEILAAEGWNPQQAWNQEISDFMSDVMIFS